MMIYLNSHKYEPHGGAAVSGVGFILCAPWIFAQNAAPAHQEDVGIFDTTYEVFDLLMDQQKKSRERQSCKYSSSEGPRMSVQLLILIR